MKQTLFLVLFICGIGLVSCRKDRLQQTIKQYDQQQIQNYIAANGLTQMKRDTTGGDTTGIYYQILNPGTQSINGVPVTPIDYPTQIAFVYTLRSFDGKYISTDTINNHYYDYVGHIFSNHFPLGLQTAIHNLLRYPDASMRVLIPSHLAYGIDGEGSGSSQVVNNKIAGNQCLDYYIHAINNFPVYDDMVLQHYIKADTLTGYTKTTDGLYYKVDSVGTSTDQITTNSTITATYTGQLFNYTLFDYGFNGTNVATLDVDALIQGVQEGLIGKAVAGTKIHMLIPSSLGYGLVAQSSIPVFSCLRFTWSIKTVTP